MDDSSTRTERQPSPAQEAALDYANRGWRVVPLWRPRNGGCSCRKGKACPTSGKHPRTRHGHADGTTDQKRIATWKWESANVGIAAGPESGLIVIDIDPHNGGRESIAELETRLGKLPAGPVVATGGGGWHLYFRHPEIAIPGCTVAPGVEIKAAGKLVVAPPSLHENGNTYRWQAGPGIPLPDLPEAWLDFLSRGRCCTEGPEGAESSEAPRKAQKSQETSSGLRLSGSAKANVAELTLDDQVRVINEATLPTGPGVRRDTILALVRKYKAIPELKDLSAEEVEPYLKEWWNMAGPLTSGTHTYDDCRELFNFAWEECRWPWGAGLKEAWERAQHAESIAAAERKYGAKSLRLRLLLLCRELARQGDDGYFFLSTHKVAPLLKVSPMAVWRWLNTLEKDGFIQCEKKGSREDGRASEYRYLQPLDE